MYINLYISTKDAVVATRNSYGEVRHRAATAKALYARHAAELRFHGRPDFLARARHQVVNMRLMHQQQKRDDVAVFGKVRSCIETGAEIGHVRALKSMFRT